MFRCLAFVLILASFGLSSGASARNTGGMKYPEASMAMAGPSLPASSGAIISSIIPPDYRFTPESFLNAMNKLENPIQEMIPEEETITETAVVLSFAGDCTLGTDESFPYVNSFPYRLALNNFDYSYFFKGVRDLFLTDDFTLVNLETTLTTAEKKAEKQFRFRGEPAYVEILKSGGVEAVNIANNHIYDYLQAGFEDTVKNLKENGILFSGEGYMANTTIRGLRITSIGYRAWNTSVVKSVQSDIAAAKEQSDILIVSFHWGEERATYPNQTQIELGRFCIDQGADVVVGHHPHVIQGIGKYKGRYILYSLGNFCFGGNRNPSDKDSFIFQNKFVWKDGQIVASEGSIIPVSVSSVKKVNDYQPTILKDAEKQRVLDRIFQYSSVLEYGIKKEG